MSVSPEFKYCEHGYSESELCRTCEIMGKSRGDPQMLECEIPLEPEILREQAHKEWEIVRLMGPSDEHEQAWLDYTKALVELTDSYLAKIKD